MNRMDGRFLLREKRIHQTLNILPKSSPVVCITNSHFAQKAKIGRATFHRHYKTIEEAFCCQRRGIIKQFQHEAKKFQNADVRSIFQFILFFIYKNKAFFNNDFFHCDCYVTYKLFAAFNVVICLQKHLPARDFDFYIYKITFLLKQWAKMKFSIEYIPKILKEMLEITALK